jgi:hypothetical protein
VNPTLGQIVLIVLVAALVVYVVALRSTLRDRVAMLVLALIGLVLVAWPGLSSSVAGFLGIGRGTDLVFYLFIVFCLFRFVSQSSATARLQRQLTLVVREQALQTARPPLEPTSGSSSRRETSAAASALPAAGAAAPDAAERGGRLGAGPADSPAADEEAERSTGGGP